MLPTRVESLPDFKQSWNYEVKYDGFRCVLFVKKSGVQLVSRNGHLLNDHFPEIVRFLTEQADFSHLPLQLDGELVMLESGYRADFSACQKRGRLKSPVSIQNHIKAFPATFLAFDLLTLRGKDVRMKQYSERKEMLQQVFKDLEWPLKPDQDDPIPIQFVPSFSSFETVWDLVTLHNGEGIILKKLQSQWVPERSKTWLKYKNLKVIRVLITGEKKNGYFSIGVYNDQELISLGSFLHGLKNDERDVLKTIIRKNSTKKNGHYCLVEPLCCELSCLGLTGNELREPRFTKFLLQEDPLAITHDQLIHDLEPLPRQVTFTNTDKLLIQEVGITKRDYLYYLQVMSKAILPMLRNRPLTVIRYPEGIEEASFYQKNAPASRPKFVKTAVWEGHQAIVVHDLETLLWLGNQSALEFHIPPEDIHGQLHELFLDLDPPDKMSFDLALRTALDVREIFKRWHLHSFVKTTGRKGLQVFIPIEKGSLSYEESNRFLSFLASMLVEMDPYTRTVERLKKNRHNRLYIDYLQHGRGKTIIAPYSLRAVNEGLVSYPLMWDEVEKDLSPSIFTMKEAMSREKHRPFHFPNDYKKTNSTNLKILITEIKKHVN